MISRIGVLAAFAILAVAGSDSSAQLWLPSVFGDHMVVQEGMPVQVWGRASAGEEVRVELAGKSVKTRADGGGAWRVKLPKLNYGGPHTLTVTAASDTKSFGDVLVGEVWVASGQSNMQWPLSLARNADREIAAANYPELRLFYVERATAANPKPDCNASWTGTIPDTAKDFSAVAYFFGRELHRQRGVPVGMIHTSWGGTPAEAWMSRAALEAQPRFAPILARSDAMPAAFAAAKVEWEKAHALWEQERDRAVAAGAEAPEEPKAPATPEDQYRPTYLYNAMIAPLVPFAIRGAIWYQGESNAGRAYQYRSLFPAMITNWRQTWGQGDFPFLFVQLANFRDRQAEPVESDWAELREAQTMTLSLPNTGMAVAIDIGDAADIHPNNKQDVGRRLWYAAERVAYGSRATETTGPLYSSVVFDGSEVRVQFKNVRRGLTTMNGAAVKGFAIAGADYKFVWADARIEGKDTVVVSSSSVTAPVAVRYGWADNPECALYSGVGLPVSPFRTDERPGLTVGNE